VRRVEVTTWYLEMLGRDQLRPAAPPGSGARVIQAVVPSPELNRFLYTAVGGDWYWIDRLGWDLARWRAYVARPELQTWVLYVSGTPAGYVELDAQPAESNDVEIASFGLLPRFVGQGLGKYLLSFGVERAWEIDPRRVWLHTCSLDGPHALANYRARGFQVYDERRHVQEFPDRPPGPWPGASG
jgi:ribosomal protein S18 acetylase RimI-like enzyme